MYSVIRFNREIILYLEFMTYLLPDFWIMLITEKNRFH